MYEVPLGGGTEAQMRLAARARQAFGPAVTISKSGLDALLVDDDGYCFLVLDDGRYDDGRGNVGTV